MGGDDGVGFERSRSVGEILAATVGLYRRFPLLFAVLAVAVIAPYKLIVLAITGHGPLWRGRQSTGTSWLLLLLETSLITPLVSALHVHAVDTIGQGRRPRLGPIALRGARALPVVVAAEIMANIGIALGFIALIIPGILLMLRWAVVAQAAALEHGSWLDALRSSRRLTRNRYGHVFGLLLVTVALGFVLYLVARSVPLGNSAHAPSVVAGIALATVVASFSALTFAVLYFDLRARESETPRQAPREYQQLRDLD